MGPDTHVPAYTEQGAGNRDIFLASRNRFLAYFEDTGYEEFYLRLLRRIGLGDGLMDVFCVGGKDELKKRAEEPAIDGKGRLFVADKDFDDLLRRPHLGPHFVLLGRYSIENYFLEEDLFTNLVLMKRKGTRLNAVADKLRFVDINSSVLGWYVDVTKYFVVAQKFRLPIKTTKLRADVMADLTVGSRSDQWWDGFQAEFMEAIRQHQHWLLEDGRLQEELSNALTPAPAFAHIADNVPYPHCGGKHLLTIFLSIVRELFTLDEDCTDHYQFLMLSLDKIPVHIFDNFCRQARDVLAAQP